MRVLYHELSACAGHNPLVKARGLFVKARGLSPGAGGQTVE